jgi:diketogulonate reductase-like aldo/keto reductase
MIMKRRRFLQMAGTTLASGPLSRLAVAQQQLRTRRIPGTDDFLPIVGLGNSTVFQAGDFERSRELIRLFTERGGAYVDVSDESRITVGRIAREERLEVELFLGTYIQTGNDGADREEARRMADIQGKPRLDLVLTRLLDDYIGRADSFLALKEEGLTRYVGVARHQEQYHERMMRLIQARKVDFVQVNYSILEPEAEKRLLPMARDNGVAILINRPFINGDYFQVVAGRPLPDWAAEFDCETWAQFSLKFILSHPAVTCVLTETANPRHAIDNIGAGFGRLPDAEMRERMRRTIQSFV